MIVQAQVINKLIRDNDVPLLIDNGFNQDYFSEYKEEFNFIQNHFNKYGRIPDQATFLEKFPDFDIIQVNETDSYLIDQLVEDKNQRLLASVFNKVRELLMQNKTDDAMSLYLNATESIVKAKHVECVDILKDTSRYDDYVERCKDFSKYYISTGFKELDKLIGGWDRQEELATIVARPGVGKSWCLLKCAVAAIEQGLKVGLYSGEMSVRKVGYRFDTLDGHISNYAITKGNTEVQNEYKRYIDKLPTKYKSSFKVLTPTMISGPAGVTALRSFVEKEDIDILFVDQHSLLEDDKRGKTPVEKASNISRDLKNLQVMEQIPIIAVSQQNRERSESGLSTSMVAQSDRISQDSTIVLFLEHKDDIFTINLVKSRDSETNKKIKYCADINKGIFQYLPEEDNALNGEGSEDLAREFGEEEVF